MFPFTQWLSTRNNLQFDNISGLHIIRTIHTLRNASIFFPQQLLARESYFYTYMYKNKKEPRNLCPVTITHDQLLSLPSALLLSRVSVRNNNNCYGGLVCCVCSFRQCSPQTYTCTYELYVGTFPGNVNVNVKANVFLSLVRKYIIVLLNYELRSPTLTKGR